MAITHIAYVTDEKKKQQLTLNTLSDVPAIEKLIERTTLPRETEQRSDGIEIFVKTENDMFNKTYSGFPEMEKALECLRQSKPDLPDLSYPPDALEHFNHIHDRLRKWVQKPKHRPHRAVKYRGPWIENRWITHFQKELESKNHTLSDVFGPYIPIFIPWTDIWVKNKFQYPRELTLAMKDLLREDVMYITVSQNADGFVGRCTEFANLQMKYQITVLSAGGYGHVPIPLLKQPEKLRRKIPIEKRNHLISYVGSSKNAPYEMREKMIAQKNHFYYYGKKWKQVMEESKFSLCPRGYGRTSYHVMEALQMGLIPIHVYIQGDKPWLPYENIMKNISYSVTNEQLPELVTLLTNMPDSEIANIEETIGKLRQDYFTFEGVLKQISKFMLDPMGSDLICQAIPSDSGSKNKKTKSCNRRRRKRGK